METTYKVMYQEGFYDVYDDYTYATEERAKERLIQLYAIRDKTLYLIDTQNYDALDKLETELSNFEKRIAPLIDFPSLSITEEKILK